MQSCRHMAANDRSRGGALRGRGFGYKPAVP